MADPQVSDPEKARHWRYFLLLESEVDRLFHVVEPDQANSGTFGLEFARLLLNLCAQFEVVARLLCAERLAKNNVGNIEGIRNALLEIEPDLLSAESFVLWRAERLLPFETWIDKAPPWWTAYNDVKHDPARQLAQANMAHTRDAAAALGLLTTMYVGVDNMMVHTPRVFDLSWAM